MDIDAEPEILFEEKNTYPVTKIINTVKKGPFRIRVFNEVCGISTSFVVNCPEEAEEYKIKVHIKMDKNGVLSLEKAEKIERIEAEPEKPEEVKMEEGKNEGTEDKKEEEKKVLTEEQKKKEEEAKKKAAKPKIKKTSLECQSDQRGMTEESLKQAIEKEKIYTKSDRLSRETLEKKNELESFIYESRSKLNAEYKEYVVADACESLLNTLQNIENWLYDEGSDTKKELYQEKLTFLNNYMKPIVARFNFYTGISSILHSYDESIKYSHDFFGNTDEKYAHISETDRQAYIIKARENQDYGREIRELLSKKQKFEDAGISTDELVRRALQQRELTDQVMSRPKPAPPKVEEKPEAKPEESSSEAKPEENKEVPNESEERKEEKPMDID